MKTFLLLIFTSIFFFRVNAQEFSKSFGFVSKAELTMTSYDQDPEASALVLYDIGESYFEEFELMFKRRTRIKIFSEAGLDYANIEIPYYTDSGNAEKIDGLKAFVYHADDAHVRSLSIDEKNFFDQTINEHWNLRKYALPNVKPGSVIEYEYTVKTPYEFNLRDWEFQWEIPLLYSEYIVKLIPFYEYTYIAHGNPKFDIKESYEAAGLPSQYSGASYNDMVHRFVMTNVPAFRDEEFVTSRNDYIIKLDFQLSKITDIYGIETKIITTWKDLIKSLLSDKDFGKYLTESERKSKKLLTTPLDGKTKQEQFETIVRYVKDNFAWDEQSSKFASKSVNNFLKEKSGNTANINLFLCGMLNAYGIEAYPVISSTRNHGAINTNYPFTHFFNNVIVLAHIDSVLQTADATERLLPADRLPVRSVNNLGLIIKKGDPKWAKLGSNYVNEERCVFNLNFDEDLNMNVCAHFTESEYNALKYRKTIGNNISEANEFLNGEGYELNPDSTIIENSDELTEPYQLHFNFTQESEHFGEKIYISPFFNETLEKHPFTQQERTYPIDMITQNKMYLFTKILIPDLYKPEYLPEQIRIDNKDIKLFFEVKQEGNNLNVIFLYHFIKSIYPPDDYKKLKTYYDTIIKIYSERIVLKKIN